MSERERLYYQFLCEDNKAGKAEEALSVIDGIEVNVESSKLLLGRLSDLENYRSISKVSGRFFADTYQQIMQAIHENEIADYSTDTRFYCWRDENQVYFGPENHRPQLPEGLEWRKKDK